MSFFPQALVSNDTSFHPLFRLVDEFDQYSRGTPTNHTRHGRNTSLKVFTPKFDVKELNERYELHGELPGIDQKNIEIEFTDAQTLIVKGRTERSYSSGTHDSGQLKGINTAGTITEGGEQKSSAHKATVEDEDAPQQLHTGQEITKAEEKKSDDIAKYWVSERSVGEFSRSFSFPARVDQEQVKASMKNGILSILVPKTKKLESRKISIS